MVLKTCPTRVGYNRKLHRGCFRHSESEHKPFHRTEKAKRKTGLGLEQPSEHSKQAALYRYRNRANCVLSILGGMEFYQQFFSGNKRSCTCVLAVKW